MSRIVISGGGNVDKYNKTVKEAAQRLEVSERTVRRKCKNGELDAVKMKVRGQEQWFIHESEFGKIPAVMNEVIDVVDVDKPIPVNKLKKAFKEALQESNQSLINHLHKQNKELRNEIDRVGDELSATKEQLEKLKEQNKEIKDELKSDNRTLLQKNS